MRGGQAKVKCKPELEETDSLGKSKMLFTERRIQKEKDDLGQGERSLRAVQCGKAIKVKSLSLGEQT